MKVTHPTILKLHISHTENAQIWSRCLKETTWFLVTDKHIPHNWEPTWNVWVHIQLWMLFLCPQSKQTMLIVHKYERGTLSEKDSTSLLLSAAEAFWQIQIKKVRINLTAWGIASQMKTIILDENLQVFLLLFFFNSLPHFLWTWRPPQGISGPPPLWLPQWPVDLSQTGPCGCPLQAHTPRAWCRDR